MVAVMLYLCLHSKHPYTMYCTKHLLLLAICVITLGSASESQYLSYAIESLDDQELIDRQIDRNDKGFQVETAIESFHLNNDVDDETMSSMNDFKLKGNKSYARKSAYY